MTPAGDQRRGWRAILAFTALAVTIAAIYSIFTSGFGRPTRTTAGPAARPLPTVTVPPEPAPTTARPRGASARAPVRVPRPSTTIAVIADNFWLTYLPSDLVRTGGGAIEPETGVEGGWARFGSGERYVEAQVEHGTAAADWTTYRQRLTLTSPRDITVRGRPAMVGEHPSGGKAIAWLERAGTGAWIRVSDALSKELIPIAASVTAPVGE